MQYLVLDSGYRVSHVVIGRAEVESIKPQVAQAHHLKLYIEIMQCKFIKNRKYDKSLLNCLYLFFVSLFNFGENLVSLRLKLSEL